MVLAVGAKLGHYKILSPIGAGGMGEVYRARDTRLKRDVAIKILPEHLMQNLVAVERFAREARAASALNHPNIITIFDIGQYKNLHFIATELVDGETLREKIKRARLDLPTALDLAIQIARALTAAHAAGIVHRDIKPENVMIRTDGYVKVLDFGLAKLSERDAGKLVAENATIIRTATNPGTIIGTAYYMSPEQARGLEVDTRSDIFSLGIVLYEMLAGCLPFTGATMSDVIAAILQREHAPLAQHLAYVPQELEWSVAKALHKNCEERYQTIKNLLHDLKRLKQRLEFAAELERVNSASASQQLLATGQMTLELPRDSLSTTRSLHSAPRRPRIRKAIDSLAVLPLYNADENTDAEYLADGITECIINSLSKLPKLRVVPRSTVFRYKGRDVDPQEAGRELGVRAVLAGRIVLRGESVVIKAELIDIALESQLWGDQYRRQLTDIFTLQEEIAEHISENLRLRLTGAEKKRLVKRYTENSEAYQFYLKGRYYVTTKRTEEWIKKGIECFQEAIDHDPNYALAYAGLADAYSFLASSTGGWSPHAAYPKAKAAALKALELDDSLGEAHSSLGFFHLLYDWNLEAAEREFKRALELSPNYPNAHDGYGFYLKALGRHEEAIEECRLIQNLDPLSPFAHVSLAWAYYFARDYDHATRECRKAIEMDSHFAFAFWSLGLIRLQQMNLPEAITALSRAFTYSNGGITFAAHLGYAYALAGRSAEALEVLVELQEVGAEQYISAYFFAIIHLGLNDLDEAFKWLEQAYKERSGFLVFLNVEPIFDAVRDDKRFKKLLKRVGIGV